MIAAEMIVKDSARLYTIRWARQDGEVLSCSELSPRTIVSRLIGAIRNSGPITVHEVVAERKSGEVKQ